MKSETHFRKLLRVYKLRLKKNTKAYTHAHGSLNLLITGLVLLLLRGSEGERPEVRAADGLDPARKPRRAKQDALRRRRPLQHVAPVARAHLPANRRPNQRTHLQLPVAIEDRHGPARSGSGARLARSRSGGAGGKKQRERAVWGGFAEQNGNVVDRRPDQFARLGG